MGIDQKSIMELAFNQKARGAEHAEESGSKWESVRES